MEIGHIEKKKVLCVVGPTACHKTEIGVQLAKHFSGEVISADSVQVYRGMDIGSAKPTVQEQSGVLHHMIDCVPIDTPSFSVSQYRSMAQTAIEEVFLRGNLPVLVGGSGLYINALLSPLGFAVPSDVQIRARIQAEYDAMPDVVYARLAECDKKTAARLHPNDGKRIVRALEVYEASGRPLSSYGNDFAGKSGDCTQYDAIKIGLNMDREALYQRINLRVERMMQRGLLQETEQIYRAGYPRSLPAMQSIGYRQLFAYFDGVCALDEAIARIQQDSRNFAKRQLTWFRRDERIQWFDVTHYDDDALRRILQYVQERMK